MKPSPTRSLRLISETGRDGALRRPRAVEARSKRRTRRAWFIPPADTRAGTAQRPVPTPIPISAISEYGLERSAASVRRQGFSVLEIMVAVALLAVIIVGLLAMFYQVQRAFRLGTSQVDVMEGGRAAISMITRDMQEVAAAGVLNATNLVIVSSSNRVRTVQLLSSGDVQNNFLQDLCFLQRRNDEWTGIAYRFPTNAFTGVGTLVRYSWSWPQDSNPAIAENTNLVMSGFVGRLPPNRPDGVSQVLDGVVHFQVEAYDAEGVLFRPPYYSDFSDSYLRRDSVNDVHAFMSTNLPAYLDIELRVLEPATLAKFRARAETDLTRATNYLAAQIGHTHVFRQRIPVRTAATLPF